MLNKVTVGMPAYNEERNIKFLIKSILSQDRTGYILEKIIVVSDASDDKTDSLVKSLKNKKVVLLRNKIRQGTALSQNRIIKNTTSDILILLDSDVTLGNRKFIKRLIAPIINNSNVGIVGAKVVPHSSDKVFSKIINYSHSIKQILYEEIKDGKSIYLCHGRARAFSRKLYKKLRFPFIPAEDAYSYLLCKKMNYQFVYEPKAKVFFKSPDNLKDHLRQSVRFIVGNKSMDGLFENDFIKNEYKISFVDYLSAAFRGFVKNPIYTILYSSILLLSYVVKIVTDMSISPIWQISKSSK